MKALKLMADYHCHPLWEDGGDIVGNVDPASLPISEDLIRRLNSWSAKFDATLDLSDPTNSGFASEALASAFVGEGLALCRALQAELGDGYLVRYQT
ncbi:hypothetical protein GOC96_16000 [Sinorhizobium medicae]|nr:hypothetical protein [Sinorhizobium medicae]